MSTGSLLFSSFGFRVENGLENLSQPRPQGLLLVQNGARRNPWPRLPKWLQKFFRISSRKHDEMSSFRLNNGFRLQKTNRAVRHWKQRPKKPFHHVSRDKILHDSWSISAALARVVPKSYRPEGQPSSPRTENPSRAFVGIVSSIPIWRSISLTKCLN